MVWIANRRGYTAHIMTKKTEPISSPFRRILGFGLFVLQWTRWELISVKDIYCPLIRSVTANDLTLIQLPCSSQILPMPPAPRGVSANSRFWKGAITRIANLSLVT